MKTTPRLLLASLILSATAFAASPEPQPKRLTVQQEINLEQALAALDGHQVVAKVNGQDAVVTVSYDFSGAVRWKILDDIGLLEPKLEAWQKANKAIIDRISGGKGFIAQTDGAGQSAYSSAVNDAMTHVDETSPKLETFTRSDLDLDRNPIPGTVLNALAPILQ